MKEIIRKTLRQASPKYIWSFFKACNTKQKIVYVITTILTFITGITFVLPIVIWAIQIYLLIKYDEGTGALSRYDEEKEMFI